MAGCFFRRAFTAYYLNLDAQYTEFSGLSVGAKIGGNEVPVSLSFGASSPHSFVLSSVLGRFESVQPTVVVGGSYSRSGSLIPNDYNWQAVRSLYDLELGGKTFSQHVFGVVEDWPVFTDYQEVGGVVSLNRESSFTRDRVLLLQWKRRPFRNNGGWFVKIKSMGRRRHSWPSSAISIPLVATDSRWSFFAKMNIGDHRNEQETMKIVVDPSSSDVVFPFKMWEDYFSLIGGGAFQLSRERGNRLFATSMIELKFDTLIDCLDVSLDPESLLFPISIENENAFSREGVRYIPLRIRFVPGLAYIVVGKALLQTYKEVYLDNMEGNMHLIPRVYMSSGRDNRLMPESSSLMLEPFIPEHFQLDPGLMLPPAQGSNLRLDNFLIPTGSNTFGNSRSQIKTKLLLVRRYPLQDIESAGKISFILRGYDPSSILCTGSLIDGIRLSGRRSTSSTDIKFAAVTITRNYRYVLIEVEAFFVPPPLPPVAPAEGECTICCDQIERGEMAQELPACGHSFHAECFQPWISLGKKTCPNCRCSFRH
jgi:hypothetical protein